MKFICFAFLVMMTFNVFAASIRVSFWESHTKVGTFSAYDLIPVNHDIELIPLSQEVEERLKKVTKGTCLIVEGSKSNLQLFVRNFKDCRE